MSNIQTSPQGDGLAIMDPPVEDKGDEMLKSE